MAEKKRIGGRVTPPRERVATSQPGPRLINNVAWGNAGGGFRFGKGVKPILEGNHAIDNQGGGFVFEDDTPESESEKDDEGE